ncbi:MAG: helix-turn-helix domain-containing protein [Rubripirellula sp.]|nr:helix-turn-helix domain-containing protein [Rubripirellula sp.]
MLRSIKYSAEYLDSSEDHILNLIRKGELPAVNVGVGSQRRRLKISDEALNRFIAQRTIGAEQPAKPKRRSMPQTQKEWV